MNIKYLRTAYGIFKMCRENKDEAAVIGALYYGLTAEELKDAEELAYIARAYQDLDGR